MSLISLQNAQMLAVLNRFQAQGSVYSSRNALSSFLGGSSEALSIHQNNFNDKFAAKMQEDAMNRTKSILKNNLSGFNTFA